MRVEPKFSPRWIPEPAFIPQNAVAWVEHHLPRRWRAAWCPLLEEHWSHRTQFQTGVAFVLRRHSRLLLPIRSSLSPVVLYLYLCIRKIIYIITDLMFYGVEGLSWSVDEKSLKDAFCSFGDVTEGKISILSMQCRIPFLFGLHLIPVRENVSMMT